MKYLEIKFKFIKNILKPKKKNPCLHPLFVLGENGTTFKGESCEIEINYTKPQNKWLVYIHK
jgi:hypothetical protein